jgi:hypothetical protein
MSSGGVAAKTSLGKPKRFVGGGSQVAAEVVTSCVMYRFLS